MPDELVPVLVLDVDEGEAKKLLARLDPMVALADTNQEALAALLRDAEASEQALGSLASEPVVVPTQGNLGPSEGAPAFQPELEPSLSPPRPVTEEDVAEKDGQLRSRFAAPNRRLVSLVCPHCGEGFKVDPEVVSGADV